MKIGFDATPLLGHRSGVGHYTSQLLKAMMPLTPDWQYLLYSKRALDHLESDLSSAVPIPGYLPRSNWLWMQLRLPGLIRRSQPELVHFTNSIAPLRFERPYILTIHDASLFAVKQFHPRVRLLYRWLIPYAARNASAIITDSYHARDQLSHFLNIPSTNMNVVYIAAAPEYRPVVDESAREQIRRKYNLPSRFLLFVGTLEPRKNITRLIAAFQQVRKNDQDCHLVVVGPYGWLGPDLKQLAARHHVQDSVHYLGYVERPDMATLYSLATCFVYPSLYEGFGLPPLEAMACGTPVVCGNNTAMAELYAQSAQLVDATDISAISDGITNVLRDPERQAALSQAGLARARALDWETTAQATLDIYKSASNTAVSLPLASAQPGA